MALSLCFWQNSGHQQSLSEHERAANKKCHFWTPETPETPENHDLLRNTGLHFTPGVTKRGSHFIPSIFAFVLYFSSFYLILWIMQRWYIMIWYARVWKKTIDIFEFFDTLLWEGRQVDRVDRRTKQQNAVAPLASSSSSNGIASRLLRSSPWLCVPCTPAPTAPALHRHPRDQNFQDNLERWKRNTKIVAKSSVKKTCAAFRDRCETMWWTRMVHQIVFWDAMTSVAKL